MIARQPVDAGVMKATVSSASILPPRMRKMRVCRAATKIDGKQTAADIRQEIAAEVSQLSQSSGKAPGLAVVLVGERKDSQTYVRSKKRACEEVGIVSFGTELDADVSEDEVLEVVREYNANQDVHGILVQLPLPKHMNEQTILDAIDISKDVDGFHPLNIGCLAMRGREPRYVSCTPKGCMELLKRNNIELSGKRACVVGRSNIVGLPMALLLQNADATVTMVHSRTPDAQRICSEADIVVAACGRTEMVKGDWIKPGATVIDVGINSVDVRISDEAVLCTVINRIALQPLSWNRFKDPVCFANLACARRPFSNPLVRHVQDPSRKNGYRLVGDVDFAAASENAAYITPVPGGVGPMTIAMLLQNCVEGFKAQEGLRME